MPDHRATGRRARWGLVPSVRVRAILGLGVALGLGATGTLAAWTDSVTVSGTTFTAGTLDLQVNSSDAPATTTLSMSGMVPGSSSAEVLVVKNANTAPLKYTMTGGLTGTDAAAYGTAAALRLTIRSGGSKEGTGNTSSCSGGTIVVDDVALAEGTTASIIGTSRPASPLVKDATESLCFQIVLAPSAPTSLQGKTAGATFKLTGTSDAS